MSKIPTFSAHLDEDLRNWFGKGKEGGVGGGGWDRYNTKGERIGKCGDAEDRGGAGEGKPKCLSTQKAAQLRAQGGKQAIANAVKRKKTQDPVTDRKGTGGAPRPVSNRIDDATIVEKNTPTNPALWSKAKSLAKSKFDVYPSAYANGWAAKWYKEHGGGWSSEQHEATSPAQQAAIAIAMKRAGKTPAQESNTPADREWGTDSLVKIYKHDTPGQSEAWERNPNCQQCGHKLSSKEFQRGDRVCAKCVAHNKGRVWGKDSDDEYEEQIDVVPMRSMNEHIVKVKDGYRLVSKQTGKNLGTYPTKAQAEKRERQVQYFKHQEHTTMSVPSFKNHLTEVSKQTYVNAISTITDPDFYDDRPAPHGFEEIIARARREHGDKFAADLERAAFIMHYPRPGRQGQRNDPLAHRAGMSKRLTKLGKLYSQDIDALKRSIEDPYVRATLTKSPSRLPEEQETVEVKPALPGQYVSEVGPPGMEDWIRKNKARFRKEYGDRGDEVLYATAWNLYHKGKSESAKDVRMHEDVNGDDDTSMAHAQLSSLVARADALKQMLATAGELPAWVQAKITDADSSILAVHDYLKFKG